MPRDSAFWLGSGGIVFQLALTRLASASLDYHLTFLVIAAAMLGGACGGVWVAGWLAPAEAGHDRRMALRSCLAAAIVGAGILAAFGLVPLARLGAGGVLAFTGAWFLATVLCYGGVSGAMALLLRNAPHPGRVYAADLAGAAAGCLTALAAMHGLGPPATAALAVVLLLIAAMRLGRRHARVLIAIGPTLALAAAGAVLAWRPNVPATKPLAAFLDTARYPDAHVELTRWDGFARVDVFDAPGALLLWQPAARQPASLPELRGITLDGDALTAAARLEPGEQPGAAARLPASLPFVVTRRRRVLVIGPGGGLDVAAALGYGAETVDAVEVSPAMAQVMRGPLAEFSGNLYARPGVHLIVGEGRSFLQRTPARYDAIVMTAVDSWAALASGAYSLAESYLYTRESFATFYEHLDAGGVLAVSRWFSRPPREMDRLVDLARATLAAHGQAPERAIILQRAGDFGTLLVRKGEFTAQEVAQARAAVQQNGFALAYDPLVRSGTFAPIVSGMGAPAALPSDNRPYFFDFTSWTDVLRPGASALPRGHAVVLLCLVESLAVTVAALGLPLRRLRHALPLASQARWAAYFAALGAGFIGVELVLQQRFTLLLGHPLLSLADTLAGLLAGAALGSWLATTDAVRVRGALLLAAVAVVLACYAALLQHLVSGALGWAWTARAGLALALAFLPAVCMGTALPLGLRRLPASSAFAWAWGINGAASALGASLATMAAMEWGFSSVLLASAACYALAAALLGLRSGHLA